MSSFGVYINSVASPIVQNVLVSLGFGTVTYAGLQTVFNGIQTQILGQMNTLPTQIAALFYLAGFNYAVGLVLAAWAMRISMTAMKRFVQV
jgi:hypothetical protein